MTVNVAHIDFSERLRLEKEEAELAEAEWDQGWHEEGGEAGVGRGEGPGVGRWVQARPRLESAWFQNFNLRAL